MKYVLYKLLPPRPTFPADITPDEARLMQQHAEYWKGLMRQGQVIAFGPVGDPKGPYGISLVRLEDGADPAPLGANDPVVLANAGFRIEAYPMLSLVLPEQLA
jgi:uncharacterized protein YciI